MKLSSLTAGCLLIFTFATSELKAQINEPKAYSYTVIVLGRDNMPLKDAKIATMTDEFRTNDQGELKYKSHLTWVTASASGYQSRKINLATYPEGEIVTIRLSRLPDEMQPIQVYVKDRHNNPVMDAVVLVSPGQSAVTDANGFAKAMHKQLPGEYVTVSVEAKTYKTQRKRVLIAENREVGSIRTPDTKVDFVMEKGENEMNVFNVIVEVLDEENDKPVNGASVQLKLSDGTSQNESTNGRGDANFSDMEYGYQGTTARVMVNHNDYEEKWSDIPEELMTAKDRNDRRFVVYIKKKGGGNWDGAWVAPSDATALLTISGTQAHCNYRVSGRPYICTVSYNNIKISGNTASYSWTGHYEDDDKIFDRKGTGKMTLNGDAINVTDSEDEPTQHWKAGKGPYSSAMRKGAIWNTTFVRKK